MTQPNGTSWNWLSPHYLVDVWQPEKFRPEYLVLGREIISSEYQPLSDLVEVVFSSPVTVSKGKWHVSAGEIRRQMFNQSEESEIPPHLTELPEEAILVSRRWTYQPSIRYWNERLYRGRGTANDSVWVLKSRTGRSIAWLQQELTRDKGMLQFQRVASGTGISYLLLESLLRIRVLRLPQELEERENCIVRNKTTGHISELRAKKLRKPFILTGRTFEERLTQFEQYLEVEGLFSQTEAFFVEPATNNRASDLFTIRPIRTTKGSEVAPEVLISQDEPDINMKWRSWFWDSSELEALRVFNTLVADDELPTYLLLHTIAKPSPFVPTNSKCIIPRFSVFRESVFPSIRAGTGVEEQLWSSVWVEMQKAVGFPITRQADNENRFDQDLFTWARSIYRPVLALKVRREEEIVGVYLLFGEDQVYDYTTTYSKLDDIGVALLDVLAPPSGIIEDATRRESLRRLSWVMHQLNGPVGRANNALEDIQEFLANNDEIGYKFVPNEDKARRRSRIGGASLDRQTLSARLQDAIKAVGDIRKISYQVRQLKRVQGDLPKARFDFNQILKERCTICKERLPELLIEFENLLTVYAFGNAESISAAIDEVFSNSCRELKERKVIDPKIIIRCWESSEELWFSIQDNALPADIPLINNPFDEDASTYAQSGRGSGLGLTIVRETFLAHGGGCSLESNADKEGRIPGVIFVAHFPGEQTLMGGGL